MTGVDAATAAKYALPALEWTWDNRSKVRKAVDKVRRWFLGKSRVLILGAGETGKSTFAKTISGGFDWLHDSPWEYRPSFGAEEFTLADHRTVEVLILPGQKQRRGREWPKVVADVTKGKYSGVILFTSYGHHSPDESSLKLHTGARTKDAALTQYLETGRRDEIEVLRAVTEAIRTCPKKLWLLSAVAKQDLWADDEDAVQSHYRSGEYGTLIAELLAAKPEGLFSHEFAFCSLVIANFLEPGGVLVKKSVAGYDYQRQIRSVRHLVELLDGLRKWEGKK